MEEREGKEKPTPSLRARSWVKTTHPTAAAMSSTKIAMTTPPAVDTMIGDVLFRRFLQSWQVEVAVAVAIVGSNQSRGDKRKNFRWWAGLITQEQQQRE